MSAHWGSTRPATTVAGDPRLIAPGHRCREEGCHVGQPPRRQFDGATRLSLEEASLLQTFPADYPWRGMSKARFKQVGDAVPPLLAAAVVKAAAWG